MGLVFRKLHEGRAFCQLVKVPRRTMTNTQAVRRLQGVLGGLWALGFMACWAWALGFRAYWAWALGGSRVQLACILQGWVSVFRGVLGSRAQDVLGLGSGVQPVGPGL